MDTLFQHANALHSSGNLIEAENIYKQLLADNADDPQLLRALGQLYYQRGNLQESIHLMRRLCEVDTNNAVSFFSTAGVFREAGTFNEAIDYYNHAIRLKPDFVNAHVNLGVIYYSQLEFAKSIDCYEAALKFAPQDIKALYNLSLSLTRIGYTKRAAESMETVLGLQPSLHKVHSNYLFNMHYLTDVTANQLQAKHLEWADLHAAQIYPSTSIDIKCNDPKRPIRVGYVSPDLHRHSVAYFMSSILECHNTSEVESFCYSDAINTDDITDKLKAMANHWRDCSRWQDAQLIQKIQQDKIDILIDLAGHSDRNRLLVFAKKAAAIQISYLGYPDITGLKTMDYRLTDCWADPQNDSLHQDEVLLRLPDGFLCYDPIDKSPTVSDAPCLKSGVITFGSFNNMPKINPELISVWAKLLHAVPSSRLLLKTKGLGDGLGRSFIIDGFADHGIEKQRIECVGYVSGTQAHLALYNRIDIALDTFPYNGTTTTCEALWMGVPVVSLAGKWHAARVGASLLSAVSLEGYIAESTDEYIDCAKRLAGNYDALNILRRSLRKTMQSSRLMNKENFVSQLENAYRSVLFPT